MALTKTDLIAAVQSQTNLTKAKSTDAIESLLEIMKNIWNEP
jgi:nucleoid DNA-binding protein